MNPETKSTELTLVESMNLALECMLQASTRVRHYITNKTQAAENLKAQLDRVRDENDRLRKTIEELRSASTHYAPETARTATEIPMPVRFSGGEGIGVFGGQLGQRLGDDPPGRKLPHPESDAAKLAAVVDAIQLRIRMAVMAESSEHQSTSERLDVTRQKLTLLELLKVAQ